MIKQLLVFFLLVSCEKNFLADPVTENLVLLKNKDPLPEIGPQMHPKQPTQWETEVLIMTNKDKITIDASSCLEKLKDPKLSFIQKEDIEQNVELLKKDIKKDLLNSHWCFYTLSLQLGRQMEDPEKILQDKAAIFQKETSRLLFLAKALDQLTKQEPDTYESYLRQRYMAISKNIFGRKLDFIRKESLHPSKP